MRKFLIAAAALALTGTAQAANLVTNGGFESGNTGFGSTYVYVPGTGPSAMVPENTYTVGTDAASYHSLWASVSAYEGDNYFIANGSPLSDAPAWSQLLTGLTVGATYNFSAYAVNVCCNSNFGGTNVSPIIITAGNNNSPLTIANSGALGSTGVWTQFTGSFVADSTSTTLSIFTDVNAASGNDFGLDAISVTAAVPEPATWLMMIAGFGFIGGVMRRRNKAVVSYA